SRDAESSERSALTSALRSADSASRLTGYYPPVLLASACGTTYRVNWRAVVSPSVRIVTVFCPWMLPAINFSFNRMANASEFRRFVHSSGDVSRLIWKYVSVRDSGRARGGLGL